MTARLAKTAACSLAALCVLASILAHGLTDRPGIAWISRRSQA